MRACGKTESKGISKSTANAVINEDEDGGGGCGCGCVGKRESEN
jgi:hypothetical protein